MRPRKRAQRPKGAEALTLAEAKKAAEPLKNEQAAIAASTLAEAREELADRRDDASAHGHRMAALSEKAWRPPKQRLAKTSNVNAIALRKTARTPTG